jgi:transcriptional regulator with XRE-family HTH domain
MNRGLIIKNLRIALGLSQNKFSALLGVTQAHLSFIEAGERNPSYKISYKIKNIAKLKGIDISLEDIIPE